jgi:DHA3 family macrolide efflux protein-like MFS transporter
VNDDRSARRGALTFGVMWFGQLVSVTGSVLSEFAIGVWLFQRTHSAALFALITLFIVVPPIVLSAFAGVLADRHSRRLVMILANAGGALTTLLLAVLLTFGLFDVAWAYVVTFLFAVFSTALMPAFGASIPMLVEERHLGRANAMLMFAMSTPRVISPPLGALLLVTIGLRGIALVDGLTFLFAVATLLPIAIPRPAPSGEPRRHMLSEAADGLRYIVPRRGLLYLMLYFAVINIGAGFFVGLFTPLVLGFASTQELGFVAGIGSVGLIATSVVMSVSGGPKRRLHGVLVGGMLLGVSLSVMGLRPSILLVGIGCFAFSVFATLADVSNDALWQSTVPNELQGRVLGSTRPIAFSSIPISILVAGPLVDRVLNPLLVPGGALASSVGQVVGVGPGRGIGFLMVVMGLLPVVVGLAGFLSPALQAVEPRPEATRPEAVASGGA